MSATVVPEILIADVMAEAERAAAMAACAESHDDGGQESPPHTSTYWDDRDLWLYRDRTVALLKRYGRMAVETGRIPSVIGREYFRARVTRYSMASFEDMAIFVHDVEMALRKLEELQQRLIALAVLEEYSLPEVARLLRYPLRTIERDFPEALDQLSRVFLVSGLMNEVNSDQSRPKTCQEGKNCNFPVTDCKQGENIF